MACDNVTHETRKLSHAISDTRKRGPDSVALKNTRQIITMQQVVSQALSSTGKAIAKQQRTAHIAKAATLDRPAQKQRSMPAERQPRKENVAGKFVWPAWQCCTRLSCETCLLSVAGSFYVDHTCIGELAWRSVLFGNSIASQA